MKSSMLMSARKGVAAAGLLLSVLVLAGCATPSWKGLPLAALEVHPGLTGSRMVRTRTDSGIEIRNYSRMFTPTNCTALDGSVGAGNWVSGAAFAECSASLNACHHLFYIKDGQILDYSPQSCRQPVRPTGLYQR